MVNTEYPRDWRSRRREVFEQDGYTCQNCERKGGEKGDAELLAYHLVPLDAGGSHDTANLLTVCRQCKRRLTEAADASAEGAAEDSMVDPIESLQDLQRAIAYVDKIESLVSKYANQVLGDGDVDEGEIVRNSESFLIDARDAKNHILTAKLMFANLHLEADTQAKRDAIAHLSEEVLGLLRYELEIVGYFQDYINVLTTVKCPKCGYDADQDSKLCGECSRELPVFWECLQCRTDVDELDEDYCSACGNELPELPPEQQRELESVQEATAATLTEWQSQLETVLTVVETEVVPAHKN
ncbi:zinc ribbon domain-containing protein [Halorientalis brevis]|uniref:Zinc ribbon domain-containing protein n=1 Tax=Halorientalis brevis TaxID=1126241 RepID=A0ABD6C721_9EURY|nr:zinc ribbon domain-containing protein [Halorientalis brevis]